MTEQRYIIRDRNDRCVMGGDRVRNIKRKLYGTVVWMDGWKVETAAGYEQVTHEWVLFHPARN